MAKRDKRGEDRIEEVADRIERVGERGVGSLAGQSALLQSHYPSSLATAQRPHLVTSLAHLDRDEREGALYGLL